MDIFELIVPFLIFLVPMMIKSFFDKKKADAKQEEKNMNQGKEDVSKEKDTDELDRRIPIPSLTEHIKKNIEDRANKELERKTKVEKQNKKYKNNVTDKPKTSLNIIKDDEIRSNEIGLDRTKLKLNKNDLVKGIVMSEILSPPKALKGRNN